MRVSFFCSVLTFIYLLEILRYLKPQQACTKIASKGEIHNT